MKKLTVAVATLIALTSAGSVAATVGGVSPEENVAQALQAVKALSAR